MISRTLIVLPAFSSVVIPTGAFAIRRPDDWGLGKWRSATKLLQWAWTVKKAARGFDRVVVVTGGVELFLLDRLLGSRKQLVAVDWLIPKNRAADHLSFHSRTKFVVIRTADSATLVRRFVIRHENIHFVHFPAPRAEVDAANGEQDYAYAAGWAHRDWPTLLGAQQLSPMPIVIAADLTGKHPADVTVLGPLSPKEGRRWMEGCMFVVLPLLDTELPSGPLILLDAMAHGKALIVSDVGGSRDYVQDGIDAILVPPSNVVALAEAMTRLRGDADLRSRLASAALQNSRRFTNERFWEAVLTG